MKQINNFLGVCLILLGVLIAMITITFGSIERLAYCQIAWFVAFWLMVGGVMIIFSNKGNNNPPNSLS